jgi:hypothetical protein
MSAEDDITPESIAAEFPGWEVWQGIDRLWHARIKGATPLVMVHDDDLDGLREEMVRYLGKTDEYWHRPEGSTL